MDTTYIVYELYPDGREVDVGTIVVSQASIKAILEKYKFASYYGSSTAYNYAITLTLFETIYGFTKGISGFTINWWDYSNSVGDVIFRVATWRIRKTDNEPIQPE